MDVTSLRRRRPDEPHSWEGLFKALANVVSRFAPWDEAIGGVRTGGDPGLRAAFRALDWTDPQPLRGCRCDVEGCGKRRCHGFRTPDGNWHSTCDDHYQPGNYEIPAS